MLRILEEEVGEIKAFETWNNWILAEFLDINRNICVVLGLWKQGKDHKE